jgi:hypothetical protein
LNCQLQPATIPESVAYFSVDLRIIHWISLTYLESVSWPLMLT